MTLQRTLLTPLLACLTATGVFAQSTPPDTSNVSLKQEIDLAVTRGLNFLKTQQKSDQSWEPTEEPAVSALVLTAFMADPTRKPTDAVPDTVDKGYQFLLSNVKPDGGIYGKGRANYNTSIALLALTFNPKPEYQQTILAARKFVIGDQTDYDEKGAQDNAFDGGFGYGPQDNAKPANADLSNTKFALESLYYSKRLFEDLAKPEDKKNDLNWGAAIKFVERCQNRPASNDQKWASDDAGNLGGFIYKPAVGGNKAEDQKLPDGRVAMRSYGSISYAGMLSFIYAGLTPEDPRVQAALKWLGDNFTLDENPGLGQAGKFYYYHTMAKALTVAGLDELKLKDGKTVDWRTQLADHLLKIQKADGSWANDEAKWMEGNPVLTTAYTLIALEHVYRALR